MKVENVKVYDLEESIIASGYPMRTELVEHDLDEKDLQRAHNLSLASVKDNGAHGQYLTGIRVAFDLTCTNKMWVEAERYRFLEFVSSQSTMHKITKFHVRDQYNEYVDPRVIEVMEEKIKQYNQSVKNFIKGCIVSLIILIFWCGYQFATLQGCVNKLEKLEVKLESLSR